MAVGDMLGRDAGGVLGRLDLDAIAEASAASQAWTRLEAESFAETRTEAFGFCPLIPLDNPNF